MNVYHPLIGRSPPTLDQLIDRADEQASRILSGARQLVAHHQDLCDQLAAAHDAFVEIPPTMAVDWLVPTRFSCTTHSVVGPGDLLRAMLALYPEPVKASLFPHWDHLPEAIRLAGTRWQQILSTTPIAPLPTAMVPSLGWRWALALDDREAPIDIRALISSLGEVGLRRIAALDPDCRDGTLTEKQAFYRLSEARSRLHEPPWFPPVPAAYIDHHGGLQALDDALSDGGLGAVLIEQGASAGPLLEAWFSRLQHSALPSPLAGARRSRMRMSMPAGYTTPRPVSEDDLHSCWEQWVDGVCSPRSSSHHRITGMSGDGFNDLRHLCTRAQGQDLSLILATTPERWAEILHFVDRISHIKTIAVPAPDDRHLLAMWIGQGPVLGELSGHPPGFRELLLAFWGASDAERRAPTPSVVFSAMQHRSRPLLPRPLLARAWRGQLPERIPCRDPEVFARYIGGPDELLALCALAASLHLPFRSPPRNEER